MSDECPKLWLTRDTHDGNTGELWNIKPQYFRGKWFNENKDNWEGIVACDVDITKFIGGDPDTEWGLGPWLVEARVTI